MTSNVGWRAPERPGDIPQDTHLGVLAYRCSQHHNTLARHYGGERVLADVEVTEHALAVLVYGEKLVECVRSGCWATALDALTAGAGLERIAVALDLETDELRFVLTRWAHWQHRDGLMDDARYDEVVRLIREESAR